VKDSDEEEEDGDEEMKESGSEEEEENDEEVEVPVLGRGGRRKPAAVAPEVKKVSLVSSFSSDVGSFSFRVRDTLRLTRSPSCGVCFDLTVET
jgi:hypothetical protein